VFAPGEAVETGPRPTPLSLHEGVDDLGIEDRTAVGHLPDGLGQLRRPAQALLEQVGQPVGAVAQELQGVLGVGVLRKDHHPDVRVLLPDVLGGLDALGPVGRRHLDVQNDRVGGRLGDS